MKNKFRLKHLLLILFLLLPVGYAIANSSEVNIFYKVMELVKQVYVKEVTDKQLIKSAFSGMLSALDPHSAFLDEKELNEMNLNTKGEFGGIGVEIMVESPGLRIISPIDDSPAFKAGIKPMDMIFAVDDQLIGNMTPFEAVSKTRGEKNTKVKVSIIRDGVNEPLEFTLVRDIIKADPIKFHLYDDIAYIRIASFSEQTTPSLKKAIDELRKKSEKNPIKGYVLDLRNNPGGILEQAIFVSDAFLEKGVIVSIKGKNDKEQMIYRASGNMLVANVPIVVLINRGSASASEIVAGALQDNERAIILGTKSFGKGSVQTVIPLANYGALKLTTALYYTPSNRSIQAEGIVPDIIVEPAKIEFLSNKDKKMELVESKLRNHLVNQNAVQNKNQGEKVKLEAWNKLYNEDYQLARAIDVLKTIRLLKK
jgi:carboxyl-terminal processing protease